MRPLSSVISGQKTEILLVAYQLGLSSKNNNIYPEEWHMPIWWFWTDIYKIINIFSGYVVCDNPAICISSRINRWNFFKFFVDFLEVFLIIIKYHSLNNFDFFNPIWEILETSPRRLLWTKNLKDKLIWWRHACSKKFYSILFRNYRSTSTSMSFECITWRHRRGIIEQ